MKDKVFFDANKNWLDDPNNMYYKANKKKSELTPEEYKTKVKAILGRIGVIVFGSIAAVIIEILLNKCNVLTWEKPWWQPNFPFILFPYRVRSVLRCGGRHSRFAEKMAAYRAWRDIIRRRIVAYYFGLTWYAWSSDRRTRQLDRKNSATATTELSERYFAYKSSFFYKTKAGRCPSFFVIRFDNKKKIVVLLLYEKNMEKEKWRQ
ncbi:MAG: hypothetical protein L6V85_07715 [Clostridiales bacterium]|nr:MAG: hypothetical protein L6V85_07715 [Clostridiales bacterium]